MLISACLLPSVNQVISVVYQATIIASDHINNVKKQFWGFYFR